MKKYSVYGHRLVAYIVDWYLVSVLCSAPIVFVYSVETQEKTMSTSLMQLSGLGVVIALVLIVALNYLYFVFLPFKKGATIGKRLVKLQVVGASGSRLTKKELLIREFVGVLTLEGALFSTSNIIRDYLIASVNTDLYFINYVFVGITVVSVLYALFIDREGRMFHDLLLKSKVVRVDS